MTLFPFFENIENRFFVVVGAGSVARGKIRRLCAFTKNIIVIDENADIDGVKNIKRSFRDSDIFLGDYVIAATDNAETNRHIAFLCKSNNIPVNSVDKPEDCTFIFPSLIKRGGLTIGISSSGKSPAFCKEMRKRIESILPEDTESILDEMERLRLFLKKNEPDQKKRAAALKKALADLLSGEGKENDLGKEDS